MNQNLYNLTNPQKSIWLMEQVNSNTNLNNVGGYVLINEPINVVLLEKALNMYIEKNEATRLHIRLENSTPLQYVADYSYFSIPVTNLQSENELKLWNQNIIDIPFSIVDSNLFNLSIFTLPDGRGGFNATLHHLVTDAWSMSLLISEVMANYSNLVNNSNFAENIATNSVNYTPCNYSDFIQAENTYLKSEKFEKDKLFWDNYFQNCPELCSISTKNVDSNMIAKRQIYTLNSELLAKINDVCKLLGISIYTFFMSIYSIYLYKLTNISEPIIGTPILNRTNFKEKHTSGMFISTVPFKASVNSENSFADFAKSVAVTQLSLFRHQKYPYSKLLEDLKRKYDFSENLYDIALSYQNARDNKENCDINFSSEWLFSGKSADSLQIHFYDMDNTGTLNIYYDYQLDKFTAEEIEALHQRILHIINQILLNNNVIIKNIEIVTAPEKKLLLHDFLQTDFYYDENINIMQIFENQVIANGDHSAIIYENQVLTYKTLNEKANQLCEYLQTQNIKCGNVVGILLPRGFDLLISILAVLKTGAAYMLIDPALPTDRVSYMLNNSNSVALITKSNNTQNFNNKIFIDKIDTSNFSTENAKIYGSNNDTFCIIYTSGSTGTPKGVTLTRNGIINLVYSHQEILNTNCCENFLSTSAVSFDMFIVENFTALLSGKTVILANEDEQRIPVFMSKLIEKYHVDFILSTPSKISLLLLNEQTASCLKFVKVLQLGGEVFTTKLYNELKKYATNSKIYNGYGPSECSACSSMKQITDSQNITIGKPFLNTHLYILNKDFNLLPIGYNGQICIYGKGVGKGYIANNELTAKSFVENPFFERNNVYNW